VAYVSKVENGTLLPSRRFAENCDKVFATNGLFARLRRRIDEGEAPSWFVPYLKLEPKADRILDYSFNCLIGVVQTEDYARAILRAGNPDEAPEIIDGRVNARLRRGDCLSQQRPPRLWLVVHETCLRAAVGGPEVMAGQLDHLMTLARTPGVDIQVLPLSAGAAGVHILPFTLLTFTDRTPPTLWTDGPLGGRLYQTPETVNWVMEHYARLRSHALSPDDSLSTIRTIHEEFR
jgi:hypothetical protein